MKFTIKENIPIVEKVAMIGLSIGESKIENNLSNPMVLDIVFKVNTFLLYTDNPIEEEINKYELYDQLVQEGTLEKFYADFPKEEQEYLQKNLEKWVVANNQYYLSLNGIVESVLEYLENLKLNAQNTEENLDLSKLENIVNLAKELGFDFDLAKKESVN